MNDSRKPYNDCGYCFQNRRRPENYCGPCSGMADGLVIENNTIYEIDLDCYECMQEQRKKLL